MKHAGRNEPTVSRLSLPVLGSARHWPGAAADKIKVVATFSVIGDMVANVAGDRVDLVTLVGPAGDTELFKPPWRRQERRRSQDRLHERSQRRVRAWLEPLLKRVKFGGNQDCSQQGRGKRTAPARSAPREARRPKKRLSQHAWLDPKNGVIYVRTSPLPWQKRSGLMPRTIGHGRAAYIKELQDLDAWAKTEMAAVPPAKRRILSRTIHCNILPGPTVLRC